jgi:hypothetical protein
MGAAALLSIATATLSAAPPQADAAATPSCPSTADAPLESIVAAPPAAGARVRIGERLGPRGQHLGRQIEVTTARGDTAAVDLGSDSSVDASATNVVTYSRVVAGASEVRVLDLLEGCDMLVAQPPGIVRSALLDPTGTAVYVHAVDGSTRADLGVSRYLVDGGRPAMVLPPLPTDVRYGRTFGTTLSFASDRGTLAVQSCGMEACRTRLLDVETGRIETFSRVPHGALVGITHAHLLVYGACHWEPCSVVSFERATGTALTLADAAWDAALVPAGDGEFSVTMTTAAGMVEVAP